MGWIEDLGKSLPIGDLYRDLAQPAVREVGQALANTTKVARFLLAPIDYLAAQHGRWQRFLKRVEEKVPEANLIEAHPQLVGPTLERLRYVEEDNIIAELFLNLLARSLDRERVGEAHPAFATLIGQLSPDEALLLFQLKKSEFRLVFFVPYNAEKDLYLPRQIVENEFSVSTLAFPENFEIYLAHLESLNLLGLVSKDGQEINMDTVVDGKQRHTGITRRQRVRLTAFGQLFARACVPDELSPGWEKKTGDSTAAS